MSWSLDFVLRTLRALRLVRRARLKSGPVKIWHFLENVFDTSGSMIPSLVPEISPCDAFCDRRTSSRNWVF